MKYEGQKLNLLQYLNQYSVVDTDISSKYYLKFIEFPTVLTVGKNTIRFIGNAETLVSNTQIYIEILDSNSNPLYYEILDYVDSDYATVVVVYVPEDTTPGNFTALFASTVNRDISNTYLSTTSFANYLWIGTGMITNSKNSNSSKILFVESTPNIDISEIITPFNIVKNRLKNDYAPTGSGFHIIGNTLNIINSDSLQKNESYGVHTLPSLSINQTSGSAGRLLNASSKFGFVYSNNFNFNSSMINGTIIFNDIDVSYINPIFTNVSYSASVVDVINNSTIKVSPAFSITHNNNTINEFKVGTFESRIYSTLYCTMSYLNVPNVTASLKNQSSLLLNIKQLKPESGMIDSIKLYYKPVGETGNVYTEYGTIPIKPRNLLVTTNEFAKSINSNFYQIGEFISGSGFDRHWDLFDSKGDINNIEVDYDSTTLLNSINIRSSVHTGSSDYYGFCMYRSAKDEKPYGATIYSNNEYVLSFNSVCLNDTPTDIDVYLADSTFISARSSSYNLTLPKIIPHGTKYYSKDKFNFGEYIGTVQAKKHSTDHKLKFTCTETGDVKLCFLLRSGFWYISNIQLLANPEFGTNHTYELVPIDSNIKRNIEYEFKINYLNSGNIQSSYETKIPGVIFDTGNTVIEGTDNIISGSIYATSKLNAVLSDVSPYISTERTGFVTLQASSSQLYGAAHFEVLVSEYINTQSYDPNRPKSVHRIFYITGSNIHMNNIKPATTSSFDLRIQTDGKLVYAVSDESLKTDFTDINLNIEEKLLSLPISKFKYKGRDTWNFGMKAQDVQQRFPEIVHSNNGIKTIDYNQLLSLLIHYIQTKFKKD